MNDESTLLMNDQVSLAVVEDVSSIPYSEFGTERLEDSVTTTVRKDEETKFNSNKELLLEALTPVDLRGNDADESVGVNAELFSAASLPVFIPTVQPAISSPDIPSCFSPSPSSSFSEPVFGPFLPNSDTVVGNCSTRITDSNCSDFTNQENSNSGFGDIAADDISAEDCRILSGLTNSGIVGAAAACAISSCHPSTTQLSGQNSSCLKKKMNKNHKIMFEPNPAVRKRLQNKYLRKIRNLLQEYCVRVGEQAVIVSCKPWTGKESADSCFRCFGANPLENVVRKMRFQITAGLIEQLGDYKKPSSSCHHQNFHIIDSGVRLPRLVFNGIPTSLSKLTQAQLRTFIPVMLKAATGKAKPGWGKDDIPIWWPEDIPFQNVKTDARPLIDRAALPWNIALRKIIQSCYEYFGQGHLLEPFELAVSDSNDNSQTLVFNSQYSADIHQEPAENSLPVKADIEIIQYNEPLKLAPVINGIEEVEVEEAVGKNHQEHSYYRCTKDLNDLNTTYNDFTTGCVVAVPIINVKELNTGVPE